MIEVFSFSHLCVDDRGVLIRSLHGKCRCCCYFLKNIFFKVNIWSQLFDKLTVIWKNKHIYLLRQAMDISKTLSLCIINNCWLSENGGFVASLEMFRSLKEAHCWPLSRPDPFMCVWASTPGQTHSCVCEPLAPSGAIEMDWFLLGRLYWLFLMDFNRRVD